MISGFKNNRGFTLVEVSVVVIILTLAFMVFLKALNTGKSVRVNSEIRTIQGSILSDIENQIRSRRFDENTNEPWSNVLGKDIGEISIDQFDDIDDFDEYSITSLTDYPGFGIYVDVFYVNSETKFRVPQSTQTNYKNVAVTISHGTLASISDTMIISPGI
mgnify:CR=1 FL=1